MLADRLLDQDTPEERIAAWVDEIRYAPDRRDSLVALLSERSPLYAGRSTNATIRIRGYILAAFEQVGLPDAALPFVLEELESGRDAYLVAAAAKALRGLASPPSQSVPFLFKAIENITYVDDALTFDSYKPRWPLLNHTTALEEIFRTFAWLGPRASSGLAGLEALDGTGDVFSASARTALTRAIDMIRASRTDLGDGCCTVPLSPSTPAEAGASCCAMGRDERAPEERGRSECRDAVVPTEVEFEDQDGQTLTYGGFFSQKPSIVVFFYSRCNNPNKCSLTITKLARLQQAIRAAGLQGQVKTAAITYDPEYDLPPRLRSYGENRAVVFDEHDRFLRATSGFADLQDYFELGVSFGPALVNRHRIELFILDDTGSVAVTFARLQWDVHDVLRQARARLSPHGAGLRHRRPGVIRSEISPRRPGGAPEQSVPGPRGD
jgi:protein SCO1/2